MEEVCFLSELSVMSSTETPDKERMLVVEWALFFKLHVAAQLYIIESCANEDRTSLLFTEYVQLLTFFFWQDKPKYSDVGLV